jgi:hypothetical protein
MGPDEQTPEPDAVVADTAALAANSAERAQAAAADAIQHAQNAAAGVAVVAAEETRQSEERLAQWQTTIQTRQEELAGNLQAQNQALETKLAQTMDAILSIQSRLDKPPENPTNPDNAPSDPTSGAEPPAEPEPPPSPPKKKAHRWI